MAIYEPGKCDSCGNYIGSDNNPLPGCSTTPCNTFGNCTLEGQNSFFPITNTVPIKTTLKGSSLTPWVRLRFESEYAPWSDFTNGQKGLYVHPSFWDFTEITTGNISQPGCNGGYRPKEGLTHDDYIMAGSGDANNFITLNPKKSPQLYDKCDERCRAAIKSFQYSWGTIDSGNKCRITIVDELGSSINQWIGRLFRNPTNTPMTPVAQAGGMGGRNVNTIPQGVYKMKVTFGWLVIGGEDGKSCPIEGADYDPAFCAAKATAWEGGSQNNPGAWTTYTNPASANTRLICSPPIWFLPDQLSINSSNGRFVYEIEGIDLMMAAQYQPSSRVYGSTANKMHFALAVKKLAAESLPPFDVDFLQVNPTTGREEPLLFTVDTNSANIPNIGPLRPLSDGTLNQTDNTCKPSTIAISDIPESLPRGVHGPVRNPAVLGALIPQNLLNGQPQSSSCRLGYLRAFERLGPLDVWPCHELGPLQTIHQWLGRVSAQGLSTTINPPSTLPPPRGISINYDPTYTNIYNGITVHGKLILWANPYPHCAQTTTDTGHIKAVYITGGPCSPVLSFSQTQMKWPFQAALAAGGVMGTTTAAAIGTTDARQAIGCRLPGRGARITPVPTSGQGETGGIDAASQAAINAGAHRIANLVQFGIEAELKVQGDPSDYLCSPISGFGKSIALIVLNPYYIDTSSDATQCNLRWSTLTSSSCNSLLTNRNWYIFGVDHQIKEGSYVTTYKLRLFAPNSEVNPNVYTEGSYVTTYKLRLFAPNSEVNPNVYTPGVRGRTPVALGGEVLSPVTLSQGLYAGSQGTTPPMRAEFSAEGEPIGYMAYIAGPVGTRPGDDLFNRPGSRQQIGVM